MEGKRRESKNEGIWGLEGRMEMLVRPRKRAKINKVSESECKDVRLGGREDRGQLHRRRRRGRKI